MSYVIIFNKVADFRYYLINLLQINDLKKIERLQFSIDGYILLPNQVNAYNLCCFCCK
jgi:hypothetical protein